VHDFSLLAWVHLYMLGFVMFSIFAAMAQLGPVVVETQHHTINHFHYLYIIFLIGIVLLIFGFLSDVTLLLYGGFFVLVSMLIYAFEFLLTLRNDKRKTGVTKAMKMSNFFLLLGILSGLTMALAYNGYVDINPHSVLQAHTFGLVVGFVLLLIMGISIILIPMFGSSKRISDNAFLSSFYTLSAGVIVMLLSLFFLHTTLQYLSYAIVYGAIALFLYQLYTMVQSRKRITHDIWALHMYVAFISFIVACCILAVSIFSDNILFLKLGIWLLFVGFFGFIILGNLYKIIPFLLWFHIYAPLIEEKPVPMLHELVPKKLSFLQFGYSFLGILSTSVALMLHNETLFYGGVSFLVAGGGIFFFIVNKLLKTNR